MEAETPHIDAGTAASAVLWSEWTRCGLRRVVISPGSRSTPLALTAACSHLDVHVVLDERSAGFFALGMARASGEPVALVCTSGSAGAHYLPAAWEATMSRVPLLICTADRPSELRDVGAAQTIDQIGLLGNAASWSTGLDVDLWSAAPDAAESYWRTHADRMWAEAMKNGGQVVHCNVPVREPFVPSADDLKAVIGWADSNRPTPAITTVWGSRASLAQLDQVARWAMSHERGLLVAGWGSGVDGEALSDLAETLGWPLLADAISGARRPLAPVIAGYDLLIRDVPDVEEWKPTAVLRLGAEPTSKATNVWLDSIGSEVVHIDGLALFQNTRRASGLHLCCDPADAIARITATVLAETVAAAGVGDRSAGVADGTDLSPATWLKRWSAAEHALQRHLDVDLDADGPVDEPWLARMVTAEAPSGGSIVVGSSMPVRDVEAFGRARNDVCIVSARGTNGIDGFIAAALGHGVATGAPTLGLCGDLTFLHGAGGFPVLQAQNEAVNVTLIVVDNGGGQIFSHLPQVELTDWFATLFGTPPRVDVAAIAGGYGVRTVRVENRQDCRDALRNAAANPGIDVIVASVDPHASTAARSQARVAAAGAIGEPAP
ncbi:MAG: 2-succinyl-5-enolpyruvyl-6-hydroxy-3-cyclohexene-1-carboxylic-acid synthase [Acidimicrobiia bacterium]|nr:2-succinyl-5-enolpyruvyl-6-hydroxy-3-cyclohexene-1-carboxylic-acid synthase [Acidimicrobiia bacterium]